MGHANAVGKPLNLTSKNGIRLFRGMNNLIGGPRQPGVVVVHSANGDMVQMWMCEANVSNVDGGANGDI